MATTLTTIQTLAPEDLREDDYVTLTAATLEYVHIPCDDWAPHAAEVRRLRYTPATSGTPYRVVRVCLPFVLVRDAAGKHATLDTRRHALARLDAEYGKKAFKCLETARGGGVE